MKAEKQKPNAYYVSSGTATLLAELGEECQRILKLLAQLEIAGLAKAQAETVLGELSAAVVHVHEHTKRLDEIIDEDIGGG